MRHPGFDQGFDLVLNSGFDPVFDPGYSLGFDPGCCWLLVAAAEHCCPPLAAAGCCWMLLGAAGHICADFATCSWEPLIMLNPQFVAGNTDYLGAISSKTFGHFSI